MAPLTGGKPHSYCYSTWTLILDGQVLWERCAPICLHALTWGIISIEPSGYSMRTSESETIKQ